jgi:hypothetical protein
MISLSPLKTLMLNKPSNEHRHPHLSAASGLVQYGSWLYVVADDENHLGVFNHNGAEPGALMPLFDDHLPLDHEQRKAVKPDLEVLALIPAAKKYPYGALLALGSGSKETRRQGVIIAFDQNGELDEVDIIDLSLLYGELKKELGKINIEGAVIVDKDIILFQRGNKKNKLNATIRFSLKQFYSYVFADNDKHTEKLKAVITPYDLGNIQDVLLCFTDATQLPNGSIVFTAAAENTSDSYLDGTCMGSVIGIIDSQGKLHSIKPIDKTIKLEGVAAQVIEDKVILLLVSDADDATIPAQLYTAELNGYPFD